MQVTNKCRFGRLIHLYYIMGCFVFAQLILMLFVMLLPTSSIQTFPDLIETGSLALTSAISSSSCAYFSSTLTIPFASSKPSASYNQAFSFEQLYIHFFSSQVSIRMVAAGQTATSMNVLIDTQCQKSLKSITVRYLVVVPPLTGPVGLTYIDKIYSPTVVLNGSTNQQNIAVPITTIASQTKTALFLRGITVDNTGGSNYIDIYCYETITDTTLNVQISTNDNNYETYLSQISMTVILINTQISINSTVSTFEVHTNMNNYGSGSLYITQTNSTTIYSSATTFFGIRSFKNLATNALIDFVFNFDGNNTIKFATNNDEYSIDMVNFVFPARCSGLTPYFFSSNSSCLSTCPPSYFNGTSTCDACSSSCLTCDILANNCTSCANKSYLSANSCVACPVQCATCAFFSNCSTCIAQYIVANNTCVVDCTSLPNCNTCSLISSNPYCTACSKGYAARAGACAPFCGDGLVLGTEQCDDNNTDDGDGCSSSCTFESYFTCNSSNGTSSACFLSEIHLEYSYTVKVKNSNSFICYFRVEPKVSMMNKFNWMNGISFPNQDIALSSCSYDDSRGLLAIGSTYYADLSSTDVNFSLQFANMSASAAKLSTTQVRVSLVAENNLSLQCYSEWVYGVAAFIQYLTLTLSCIALLMMLIGYIGGKLIVLEQLAVLQITYLCLETVHYASPTYHSLRQLKYSIGSTRLTAYDYSYSLSRELKGTDYSYFLLQSYNIALGLVLLPIIIAIILKILSITLFKSSQILPRLWALILGEMTFYGLMFTAYMIFSQMCFDFTVITARVSSTYISLVIAVCQALLLLVYCYFLNKLPMHFGDFKKKFERFNICQYYYTFVAIQRFITSIFIMVLRDISYGLMAVIAIIGSQLIFVAYRKPYVCGDNKRPVINLAITIIIITTVLLSNLFPSVGNLQLWAPLFICLLLAISLASNIYYLICQFKEICEKGDDLAVVKGADGKNHDQSAIIFEKIFKMEEAESIEQKNRFQFNLFKQRLIHNHDELKIGFKPTFDSGESQALQRERLNYEWDKYPIITNNLPILEQIRSKAKVVAAMESNQS